MSSARFFDAGACLQDGSQLRVALLPLSRPTPALLQAVRLVTELNCSSMQDAKLFYCQETDRPVLPRMPWDREGRCTLRYLLEPESRHAVFWADLHAYVRPLGLVGIADGADIISLNDVMEQFQYKAQELGVKVLRLFIFGGAAKWRAKAEASPKGAHVSFLPPIDDPALGPVLRQTALDLTACLIMRAEALIATAGPAAVPAESALDRSEVLTGSKSALEDVQKAAARLTANEDEDRRRRTGRLRKMLGDLSLAAGSPEDALEHYKGALEASKAGNDAVWIAGAHECLAAAKFQAFLLVRGLPHLTQPGFKAEGGPPPPGCLAPILRKEELKALLADIRPHLTEAAALYRKRGVYDRAAAVQVRLARFLGQMHGAGSKTSRLEILEALWAALDLAQATRPELRLGCIVEVANVLGEAGCLRKRGLLLREGAEVAFDMAGQSLVSSLELAMEGARQGGEGTAPFPSNPRVLPPSLHGLPPFASLVGTAPEGRVPWSRLAAECLKAAVGASASEKREGALWGAACRLLREHTPSLSPAEQGLLIKDLEKAAERIRATSGLEASALPPPPPPQPPASTSAPPVQHKRTLSATPPPPPPPPQHQTPLLLLSSQIDDKGATLGPGPLVSLRSFVDPPEPHWPLQVTFGGAKKKKTGPFLYAAFKGPKGAQKAGPLGWVVGEAAAVEVEVSNPLDIELRLDKLSLTGELTPADPEASEDGGPAPPLSVTGIPITATIAPRTAGQRVVLLMVVPRPGTLRITGCEITWLGISWREAWLTVGPQAAVSLGQQHLGGKSAKAPPGLAKTKSGGDAAAAAAAAAAQDPSVIPVFGSLPMLSLRMMPDADVLREHPTQSPATPEAPSTAGPGSPPPLPLPTFQPRLSLLEGERRTLSLEVRNEGTLPADRARLSFSPKGSLPTALRVSWDERRLTDHLPLLPGHTLRLPLHVEALGSQGSPADLSDLTLHCTLEYLGSSGDGDQGIGRRCSYKFEVEIVPAVSVLRAQVVERAGAAAANARVSRASQIGRVAVEESVEDAEGEGASQAWAKWEIGRAYAPELVLQVEVENRFGEDLTLWLRRVHVPSVVQGNSDDPGMPPPPVVIDANDTAQQGQATRAGPGGKTRAMIVAESWTEGSTAYTRGRGDAAPMSTSSSSPLTPGAKVSGITSALAPPSNAKDAAQTLSMYYCLDWLSQGKQSPRSGTLLLLPSLFEPCMGSLQIRQQLFPSGIISLLGTTLGRRADVGASMTGSALLGATLGANPTTAAVDFQIITREMFAKPDDLTLLRSTQGVRLRIFAPLTVAVRMCNRTQARCAFRVIMQCFTEDNNVSQTAATFAGVNRGLTLQLDPGQSADHEVTVLFREVGLFYVTATITDAVRLASNTATTTGGGAGSGAAASRVPGHPPLAHAPSLTSRTVGFTASSGLSDRGDASSAAAAYEGPLETFSRPIYVLVK